MNKEQIKQKINLLKEDLSMQIEGSVMADSISIEIEFLKNKLQNIKTENEFLKSQLNTIEEDGTCEHNKAIELRQKLSEALLENDKLKKLCRKLYGTVLHVHALAKEDPIVLIGPALYKEAASNIKEYESL
jgi:hypothetical protein